MAGYFDPNMQPQMGMLNGGRPLGGMLQNNSALLTTLGASLIGGGGWQRGFQNFSQNAPLAVAADQKRRADQEREVALNEFMRWKSAGADPSKIGPWAAKLGPEFVGNIFPAAPDPTDDIREYNLARQQGFPGSFTDYMIQMKKAGASSVNVGQSEFGTIPAGYALKRGDDGSLSMEPIPGGPIATEQAAADTKKAAAAENKGRYADIVLDDIDRSLALIKEHPGTSTGAGGVILDEILPGGPASRLTSLTNTIQGNIALDKLQAAREASPTGGALGNVSDRDMALMTSALGDLSKSQGAEQLTYNLKRLKNVYLDIVHGVGQGPAREELAGGGSGGGPVYTSPSGSKVFSE